MSQDPSSAAFCDVVHRLFDELGGVMIPTDDGRHASVDASVLLSCLGARLHGALGITLAFAVNRLLLTALAQPRSAYLMRDTLSRLLHEMPQPLIGTLRADGLGGFVLDLPADPGDGRCGRMGIPIRKIREGFGESRFEEAREVSDIGGIEPLGPISGHGNGSGAENSEPAPSAVPGQIGGLAVRFGR